MPTFAFVKAPAFSAMGVLPSGCGFLPPVAGNQQLICATARIRARLRRRQADGTGTVKWFNPEKGFGFIAPDAGSADVYVHHSAIDMGGYRTLEENQKVEYTTRQGPKGLQADQVHAV